MPSVSILRAPVVLQPALTADDHLGCWSDGPTAEPEVHGATCGENMFLVKACQSQDCRIASGAGMCHCCCGRKRTNDRWNTEIYIYNRTYHVYTKKPLALTVYKSTVKTCTWAHHSKPGRLLHPGETWATRWANWILIPLEFYPPARSDEPNRLDTFFALASVAVMK